MNQRSDIEPTGVATAFEASDEDHQQPSRFQSTSTGRLLILAMFLVVLGPVAYRAYPVEVARWQAAAALEQRLQGDTDGALRQLEKAITWDRNNLELLSLEAEWRLDAKSYTRALQIYDDILERDPLDTMAHMNRATALQHLGRHAQAIAVWEQLVDRSEGSSSQSRATMLNGLAYAQAVGNTNLKDALKNVEQALELTDDNAAMLDTRGYIHYLLGDLTSARSDLDRAVEASEMELVTVTSAYGQAFVDRREFRAKLEPVQTSVAVIRYHRALAARADGATELAEQDLERVRQLNQDPGPHLF